MHAIALLDNNLRFAKKAKLFIDDVLKKMPENTELKTVNKRTVCLACILIVKEAFTSSISDRYFKEQTENKDENSPGGTLYAKILISEYGTDALSIKAITNELENQDIQSSSSLVKGLFNYFKYYDSSFFVKKEEQKRLLTKSIFYYNDYDKEIAIREVINKIYKDCDEFDDRQIYDAIRDVLRYNNDILKEVDFNSLANKICEIENEKKKQKIINYFNHDLYFDHSKDEESKKKIV